VCQLPAAGPVRKIALQELIKLDIEYRWRKGGQPKSEEYLVRWPEIGPAERLSEELIAEEYRVRQRWGDRPAHAEYAARFPVQGEGLLEALRDIDAELDAEFNRNRSPVQAPAVPHAEPVDRIVPLTYLLDKVAECRLLPPDQLEELNGELRRRLPE